MNDVTSRVRKCIDDACRRASHESSVVVVTHAGVLALIRSKITEEDRSDDKSGGRIVRNCSVGEMRVVFDGVTTKSKWIIDSWGEVDFPSYNNEEGGADLPPQN